MAESLPPVKDKSGLAITSLVLGIVSICPGSIAWPCIGLTGLAGLIVGFLGLKSSKKGMATAGIILSALALVWMVVAIILTFVTASSGFWNQWQDYFNQYMY